MAGTSNNKYAHRIYADGRIEKIPIDKPTFLQLKEWIGGGHVAKVKVRFQGKICEMVVDEDGRFKGGHVVNDNATKFVRDMYPGYGYIAGDAVVLEGFSLASCK